MPKFRFVVQAPSGKIRRGTIAESDEQTARNRLREAGFTVVSLNEESDIVVHAPAAGASNVQMRVKPERAALIDFEETLFEKFQNFVSTFFLRKEAAIFLGVVGVAWILYSMKGSGEQTAPVEPEYLPVKIEVTSDVTGFDADTLVVRLPEVPYTKSAPVSPDPSGKQQLVFEIDVMKIPTQVEVQLVDNREVLASERGELAVKGGGVYGYTASPTAVTGKDDL